MNIQDLVIAAAVPLVHVAAVAGGEWSGACPKCGGRDRFRIWPEHPKGQGGRFLCRQCGWQGDAIAFAMDHEGLTYPEACRRLGAAPKSRRSLSIRAQEAWTPKSASSPDDAWMAAAGQFVDYAFGQMGTSDAGRAYAASRGLTASTVAALRIGWNPSDRYEDRAAWGLPPDVSEKTGKPRRVWLPKGLVIPTLRDGQVVAGKTRRSEWTPEDPLPKYCAITGSTQAPMVLAPGQGKPVVIVESELDAILCAQEARDIVCAIAMRTARAKPDAEAHEMLKASPVILVATDADEAGATAWPWWRATYSQAKRWPVPGAAKDVGDMAGAPGLVRAWVQAGIPEPMAKPKVEPAPTPEPSRPAVVPALRRAAELAAGEPCPYRQDQLDAFAVSHPHLRCCPATKPAWNWREASWCSGRCVTPCELQSNQ